MRLMTVYLKGRATRTVAVAAEWPEAMLAALRVLDGARVSEAQLHHREVLLVPQVSESHISDECLYKHGLTVPKTLKPVHPYLKYS